MYFNVDDAFAFEGNRPIVAIDVGYYDLGSATLTLQYDSIGDGAYKSAGSVTLGNKDTWKQFTFYLDDAYFGNRQNNGADFRLSAGVGTTFYLDLVQLSATQIVPELGDFNADGIVDAADYVVWRKSFGTTYTTSDYDVWRAHFGQTAGSGSVVNGNAAIREPKTLVLMLAAASWCLLRSRAA
jgi:hypothetical protein